MSLGLIAVNHSLGLILDVGFIAVISSVEFRFAVPERSDFGVPDGPDQLAGVARDAEIGPFRDREKGLPFEKPPALQCIKIKILIPKKFIEYERFGLESALCFF